MDLTLAQSRCDKAVSQDDDDVGVTQTQTWAGGAVARACGGVAAQPPWGLGGGEATPLHWAESPKVEARQRGSEGGVVHVGVTPPWCAKTKGGAPRSANPRGAPPYHALLHQPQVILHQTAGLDFTRSRESTWVWSFTEI